jgi:Glycosyltransferase (GlcNAc)
MSSFNSKHLKNKGASAPPTIVSVISQGALVVVSFIWILAVIKVFLLEGNRSITRKTFDLQRSDSAKPVLFARSQLETNPAIFTYSDSGVRTFISLYDEKKRKLTDKAAKIVVPTASEWAFIRASPDYRIAGDREPIVVDAENVAEAKAKISLAHKVGGDKDAISEDLDPVAATMKKTFEARVAADLLEAKRNAANGVSSKLTKQSDLMWPPVQQDGTILASDGVDIMPVIGLKVPRFYMPATEAELNKVGSKVNGQETIFLMIASYRDFQCRETITSAYMRSDHPERLFVGAVDQTVAGDIGCLDIEIPCTVDNTQPICKYRDQISVFNMDAMYATGPVTG